MIFEERLRISFGDDRIPVFFTLKVVCLIPIYFPFCLPPCLFPFLPHSLPPFGGPRGASRRGRFCWCRQGERSLDEAREAKQARSDPDLSCLPIFEMVSTNSIPEMEILASGNCWGPGWRAGGPMRAINGNSRPRYGNLGAWLSWAPGRRAVGSWEVGGWRAGRSPVEGGGKRRKS